MESGAITFETFFGLLALLGAMILVWFGIASWLGVVWWRFDPARREYLFLSRRWGTPRRVVRQEGGWAVWERHGVRVTVSDQVHPHQGHFDTVTVTFPSPLPFVHPQIRGKEIIGRNWATVVALVVALFSHRESEPLITSVNPVTWDQVASARLRLQQLEKEFFRYVSLSRPLRHL